jgi:uncharacterized SAM-binding protein YcdF (DUF218 family)
MISRTRYVAGAGPMQAYEPVGWGWSERLASCPGPSVPVRRVAKGVAATACGLAALVVCGFVLFVRQIDRAEHPPASRTDGIVALTGGAQRIGDAIDLLAKGYADRLLITGVNERTSRDEIARLNPGQRRLFDCCVDLDYRARNTIGNAIATRRWLSQNGFRSLIVVTSNYHMPRTLLELEHALPNVRKVPYAVVGSGADVNAWWRSPSTARLLASEYAKFVAMWARTRFERDPEGSRVATMMGRTKPIKVVVAPLPR